MNIIQSALVIVMAFSMIFVGEAEAKSHAHPQTRARILKEINDRSSQKKNLCPLTALNEYSLDGVCIV